ncbi:MAG: YkgJ family cysteine cluster protein [Methylocystis sp.]
MGNGDDNTPLALFKALQEAFGVTIRDRRRRPDLVKELSVQAFDSFDGNVAIQIEDMPALACHQGCAACCDLRVAATAPEILLIAQYVVATRPAFFRIGLDLAHRVARDASITSGLDDERRLALRRPCPFIENGLCLVYRARPLACRGHASYDKSGCAEAVADRDREALVSMPHFLVRCVVQNALLASLRDAGLAWGLYELNSALNLALTNPGAEAAWRAGGDPLAGASIAGADAREMAATFDAIKFG